MTCWVAAQLKKHQPPPQPTYSISPEKQFKAMVAQNKLSRILNAKLQIATHLTWPQYLSLQISTKLVSLFCVETLGYWLQTGSGGEGAALCGLQ